MITSARAGMLILSPTISPFNNVNPFYHFIPSEAYESPITLALVCRSAALSADYTLFFYSATSHSSVRTYDIYTKSLF